MFLHPQMQRSLYKTLRKIAETNQVIQSYRTARDSRETLSIPRVAESLLGMLPRWD
jgi:hypothetical protein